MMKTFDILYIDDDLVNEKETREKITPLVRELSSQGKLKFHFEYPEKLEPFVDVLADKYKGVGAIMIDLKLNENHNKRENYATYPAQILANAIRTYQNGEDQKFDEFPLFLISSWENKEALYDTDVKSHDLFDLFISKKDIPKLGKIYENKMYEIISTYKEISTRKPFFELLGLEEIKYKSLNIDYDSTGELVSTISQFIFNDLIIPNGALISEDVLAARLGIDLKESKDWNKLKEIIDAQVKYKGVFSKVWERWWADDLIDWWEYEISSEIMLINSTAGERVKFLKEKLGLKNLKVALPIEKYMSTSFWTVCIALNQPIDIYDALVTNFKNESWQDKEYVSPTAVFEGLSKQKGIKLHPSERDRYEELKAIYKERKYGNK